MPMCSLPIIIFLITFVEGGTLNDSTTLVNNLLSNYNKNVRPVNDHESVNEVRVLTYLKSIQEFDEVREVFAYTGAFTIIWHDAGMIWDPDAYGGIDKTKISYKHVWVPDLVLTTPTEEVESFGRNWQMIDYENTGLATWTPGGLMKSTCSVDVANYPFDKQTCTSDFTVWGYDVSEVQLLTESDQVDTSLFSGNVAWVLANTSVNIASVGGWSQLEVTFYLKRKPAFVVINILMPILFLSLINVLVFILAPESGERVSYCITVLLSIAVFMTIISDTLPRSSEPLPIISYKLMLDMIISSLITLITILNLRLYHKDHKMPVPEWLKTIHLTLYRQRKCKSNKNSGKIHPKGVGVLTLPHGDELEVVENEISNNKAAVFKTNLADKAKINEDIHTSDHKESRVDVTWRDISKLVDSLALFVFTILTALSFGAFFLYVSQN